MLEFQPEREVPIEIDVHELKSRLDRDEDLVLIDCREPSEHAIANIKQALLLPMSEMQARSAELGSYQGKHIVVHCHHGGRSLTVANWLRQSGFRSAQSLQGGIHAWSTEIDPSVPTY